MRERRTQNARESAVWNITLTGGTTFGLKKGAREAKGPQRKCGKTHTGSSTVYRNCARSRVGISTLTCAPKAPPDPPNRPQKGLDKGRREGDTYCRTSVSQKEVSKCQSDSSGHHPTGTSSPSSSSSPPHQKGTVTAASLTGGKGS